VDSVLAHAVGGVEVEAREGAGGGGCVLAKTLDGSKAWGEVRAACAAFDWPRATRAALELPDFEIDEGLDYIAGAKWAVQWNGAQAKVIVCVTPSGIQSQVYAHGKPIPGVRSIRIDADTKDVTRCVIEVCGVEVFGVLDALECVDVKRWDGLDEEEGAGVT